MLHVPLNIFHRQNSHTSSFLCKILCNKNIFCMLFVTVMDKGKTRQGGTKNCAEKFVFARYVAQTHI